MLDSKNLETSTATKETDKKESERVVENREEVNLINPEYLSLMYNSMY